MYLNFSNFRGWTSAGGGGGKPWSKNRDKCWMGDWQNCCQMGGSPSPPRKKPYISCIRQYPLWLLQSWSTLEGTLEDTLQLPWQELLEESGWFVHMTWNDHEMKWHLFHLSCFPWCTSYYSWRSPYKCNYTYILQSHNMARGVRS